MMTFWEKVFWLYSPFIILGAFAALVLMAIFRT